MRRQAARTSFVTQRDHCLEHARIVPRDIGRMVPEPGTFRITQPFARKRSRSCRSPHPPCRRGTVCGTPASRWNRAPERSTPQTSSRCMNVTMRRLISSSTGGPPLDGREILDAEESAHSERAAQPLRAIADLRRLANSNDRGSALARREYDLPLAREAGERDAFPGDQGLRAHRTIDESLHEQPLLRPLAQVHLHRAQQRLCGRPHSGSRDRRPRPLGLQIRGAA